MQTRIWTWMGLLAAIAIIPLPAWGQLAAGMSASRTSGTAPLYVFFDGTTDAGVSHTDPDVVEFRDLLCEWEFGDPASGSWSNSGKSKNSASGCIAAHIYESPGTYTVTHRVSDEAGNVRTVSMDINVISPDVTWSGTDTVCFENGSGFAGCPAGARQISTGSYNTALANGCDLNGNNVSKRCLFRRGDRFTVSGSTQIWDGPILIGAFGSGLRPIIDGSASSGTAIHTFGRQNPAQRAGDIRIVGLEYIGANGVQGAGHAVALCGSDAPGGIDDVLLMDLTVRSFGAVLACSSSGNPREVTDKIALVNNSIHDADHRSIGFIHATRAALLNNTTTDGGFRSSHVRISFGRKFLIQHNLLAGATGNASIKLPGNAAEALGNEVPDLLQQRFWLISDNQIDCNGGNCIGGYNDASQGGVARLDQAVVERNRFEIASGSTNRVTDSCFAVSAFRNNVSVAGSDSANPFFDMNDAGGNCQYPRDRLRIYNNTFYATGDRPRFAIRFMSGNNDSIVRNNLYYTPGDSSGDRIVQNTGGGGTGNIFSSNVQTNADIFRNQGGFDDPVDFRLDPSAAQASLAVDAGFDLRSGTNDGEVIFLDFDERCLDNDVAASRRDLGAFESGSVTCPALDSGSGVPALAAPVFLP